MPSFYLIFEPEPELAAEALDVAVLLWLAWLDQDMCDAMTIHSGHECPAGELRTVVGARGQSVVGRWRHGRAAV